MRYDRLAAPAMGRQCADRCLLAGASGTGAELGLKRREARTRRGLDRSRSASCSGGTGLLNRKPCISSQA